RARLLFAREVPGWLARRALRGQRGRLMPRRRRRALRLQTRHALRRTPRRKWRRRRELRAFWARTMRSSRRASLRKRSARRMRARRTVGQRTRVRLRRYGFALRRHRTPRGLLCANERRVRQRAFAALRWRKARLLRGRTRDEAVLRVARPRRM